MERHFFQILAGQSQSVVVIALRMKIFLSGRVSFGCIVAAEKEQ